MVRLTRQTKTGGFLILRELVLVELRCTDPSGEVEVGIGCSAAKGHLICRANCAVVLLHQWGDEKMMARYCRPRGRFFDRCPTKNKKEKNSF